MRSILCSAFSLNDDRLHVHCLQSKMSLTYIHTSTTTSFFSLWKYRQISERKSNYAVRFIFHENFCYNRNGQDSFKLKPVGLKNLHFHLELRQKSCYIILRREYLKKVHVNIFTTIFLQIIIVD